MGETAIKQTEGDGLEQMVRRLADNTPSRSELEELRQQLTEVAQSSGETPAEMKRHLSDSGCAQVKTLMDKSYCCREKYSN